ncbi:MAG: plasmid recombination protein [Oscillospiraceae bacterium]|nr:plasmid recombination protein [Oscillospiraceae bacterium]
MMSNEVKALSISFRSDDGCIEHNNRDFFTDNVDKSRTPNNITYIKSDLRELYHELFDEALAEYNAKQTRPDRQIPDYYEHIRKSKKEKLFQEIIVMFGNSENCGVGSVNWDTAAKLLDEYMSEFERRNPNLKVFNAVMHLDEATPHLHIDFVPVCYGQKQGLSTRVSMKRAIQQMGFTASGKKETEAILWGSSERAKLTEILNNNHIARQVVGAFHDHKSVEEYKRYAQIIGDKNAHINALKKENPVDLSSTDVCDILNQNDFMRETITKQQAEISQLRARTTAQFMPIEIYNDEKRQYIIEQLQRVNSPFVEEYNTIYVPEYYEPSVKKALVSFKPMDGQNMRERMKFFIDRLLYSAQDFEDFIKLLKVNKYEVRRAKYIAVKPPFAKKFFRLKSLGEDYSEHSLRKRIECRNDVPTEFEQAESRASKVEKPFYSAINTSITLVRKFEITPAKWDKQQPYDFMNDLTIGRLLYCLNTLSELNIKSREQLYSIAADLQEKAENGAEDIDLKTQLSQIESVIRTYEEIVEGNYIDNLIKAERELREAEQKTDNSAEQKPTQTVNRKPNRR